MTTARTRAASRRTVLVAGLVTVACSCGGKAGGGSADQNGIRITDAVSPAPAGGVSPREMTMAVYLTISETAAADTLDSIATPVARTARVHDEKMDNGMQMMMPVSALPVERTHPVRLAPGGSHIMLENLVRVPASGDSVPLVLFFRHAGAIRLKVPVVSYGALDSHAP